MSVGMKATSFIYKNIASEDFGLYIGGINQNGVTNTKSGINSEYVYDFIPTRDENFIFNIKQKERLLSFDLSLYSEQEITAEDVVYIEEYLFSNTKPEKLIICQEDMMNSYYMGTFTSGEKIKVGGVIIGYNVKFTCDSAYIYSSEKITSTACSPANSTYFVINNTSSGLNYLYPKLSWKNTSDNGWIAIVNISDNERKFEMTGLTKNEIITIDKWQQMTSSLGLNRLENCNYNFIRLKKGINKFAVSGTANEIKFTYNFLWSM